MAVEINVERKAVEVRWDPDFTESEFVDLKAENAATGDKSNRTALVNDGYATITYPADYHGTSTITISDADGNEETGEITV